MRLMPFCLIAVAIAVSACSDSKEPPTTDTGTSGVVTTTQSTQPAPVTPVTVGPAPGSVEEFVAEVGDRVFFAFDQASLSPESQATLDRQVTWLQQYPEITVLIEGHCDERGTRDYNLALGERRANAVRDYLVASGINPDRLATISYGKERPVAFGATEEAWAQNRRGVTTIN